MPAITRKTDKGLPQYRDAEESDVFILSGAEDLVPVLDADGTRLEPDTHRRRRGATQIHRYRPRIEGLFARIERWTQSERSATCTGGRSPATTSSRCTARTPTPASPIPPIRRRIFSWLICESHDDKGNAVVYEYKPEDGAGVDLTPGPRAQPRRARRPAPTPTAT